MIESVWRWGNLGLAFLLELAAIVALGYWGFHAGESTAGKLLLGLGAPAVGIGLWALFAAPTAKLHTPLLYALTVVVVVGGAGMGLWFSGLRTLGLLLPALFVANLAVVKLMHLDVATA
ncbi:YrdB family protein [Amycolatopsis sp. NPDC051372]|uniref:YrdB family protein n=1 Tax=Amycolatopsis sp. NPDC051372 TaxID=3155669 RepID=UPI00342546DC